MHIQLVVPSKVHFEIQYIEVKNASRVIEDSIAQLFLFIFSDTSSDLPSH